MTTPNTPAIDTNKPLPLTLSTLEFVPPERRWQYTQQMDGAFHLAKITLASREFDAYGLQDGATARFRILPEDTTAATVSAVEERQAKLDQAVRDELRLLEEKQRLERVARERAALDAKKAKLDAEHAEAEKAFEAKYRGAARTPERTIGANDNESFIANLEGIAKGTVRVEPT